MFLPDPVSFRQIFVLVPSRPALFFDSATKDKLKCDNKMSVNAGISVLRSD